MTDPACWPAGRAAALSFSFDDARLSQVDNGLPLFERLGVHATWYVSLPAMEQRLLAWRKAVAAGQEIGNHTAHHPCSGNFVWSRQHALEEYTLEEMREELIDADMAIRDALGVTPTSFAYPCGQTFVGRGKALKSYIPLVAERYRVGRTFRTEMLADPIFCDLAQIGGYDGDAKPLEALRTQIDRAVTEKAWLVVAGHEIRADGRQSMDPAVLEAACRYALDHPAGVWVDTVSAIGAQVASVQTGAKAGAGGSAPAASATSRA